MISVNVNQVLWLKQRWKCKQRNVKIDDTWCWTPSLFIKPYNSKVEFFFCGSKIKLGPLSHYSPTTLPLSLFFSLNRYKNKHPHPHNHLLFSSDMLIFSKITALNMNKVGFLSRTNAHPLLTTVACWYLLSLR